MLYFSASNSITLYMKHQPQIEEPKISIPYELSSGNDTLSLQESRKLWQYIGSKT